MANILISGGTGLIGEHLGEYLKSRGHAVAALTRNTTKGRGSKLFHWNIDKNQIDPEAISWAEHLIHLAGENVGQRWTPKNKKKILNSRIRSTRLLADTIRPEDGIESFISASAIGYYGVDTGDLECDETTPKGLGFLAEVVEKWEAESERVKPSVNRVVKIRTGIVLTPAEGALERILKPIRFGLGAPLGSGRQWMSWIHILDLVRMFTMAIETPVSGVFNGVAPKPVTNQEFTEIAANNLRKPLFLPNVPSIVLKFMLGEMSSLVLGGNKVKPMAFQKEGFTFEFPTLDTALADLAGKSQL